MNRVLYSAILRQRGFTLSVLFLLVGFFPTTFCYSQISITGLQPIEKGLYFLTYDSTSIKKLTTKSTIIEFDSSIGIIELPIVYTGGGATVLKDYTTEGEAIRNALQTYFPTKPIKYIFSSHWHPHSVASLQPFISNGTTLITTRSNFKRIREMLDSTTYALYQNNICFVEDSLPIHDKSNSIVCYRFTKKDYPNVPTEDYLFFNLPRYNSFYSSCMYQRLSGIEVCGKELVSGRVEDVSTFLHKHNISPKYLLGFTSFPYEVDATGRVPADTLTSLLNNGTLTSSIIGTITNWSEPFLETNMDSAVNYILLNKISFYYVNMAVYKLFAEKKLQRALLVARLQTLLNPTDANSWDTYGEAYYVMGKFQLAKYYEKQCFKLNKDASGGENIWKKDLENFQQQWNSLKK
ncbi:MAG: hypothetical protein K1X91_11690 [Bacteriodetes bacterium]|nr:hypothetical protein [Bacteroidota bacterium]